jgi:PadR family transcriptional regulator, regulatory protein PadR
MPCKTALWKKPRSAVEQRTNSDDLNTEFQILSIRGPDVIVSVTDVSVHEGSVSKPTDLVQGTLDLLILKVLALEPQHGWAIAQRIRQMSGDVLQVGQSALYPALHKLERQGWITSKWDLSETNRRAKYYALTASGKKAVAAEAANWLRLSAAISTIVRTSGKH